MLAPFQVCEIARLIAEGVSNRQIPRVTGASRASDARYRKVPDRGMNAEVRRRPRDYKMDAGDQSALANLPKSRASI